LECKPVASENPIRDNPTPSHAEQDTADQNKRAQHAGASTVRPEMRSPPSHLGYKISCDKKRDVWDYAKLIAEFVGLGFLIAYTIFAGQQVREMRRAARLSKDQFRADQRPWIYADGHVEKGENAVKQYLVNGQPLADYYFDIPIQFSNVGKTPALVVDTMPVELRLGPSGQIDKEMENFMPLYSGKIAIGAVPQSLPRPMTMGTSKQLLTISPSDFTKVVRGDWHAYLVGAIKYRDTFQPLLPPYETVVCVLYNPNGIPVGHVRFCGYMH
jgi:hypothetical protein